MEKLVNHFQKEGYPRLNIYDTTNRMQLGETINDKKKTGRPTFLLPFQKESAEKIDQWPQRSQSKTSWSKFRCFPYDHV